MKVKFYTNSDGQSCALMHEGQVPIHFVLMDGMWTQIVTNKLQAVPYGTVMWLKEQYERHLADLIVGAKDA